MIAPGFKPPESGRAKEALRHFATAFAFLLLGIVALVANSKALAAGEMSGGAVVAGLHLITLGWLSLSIFGALQVFMGVALGVNTPSNQIPAWTRRFWTLGVISFSSGLYFHRLALIAPGVLLLGAGYSLLAVQLVPALFAAKRGHLTRAYVGISLFSLGCAWSLGTLAGLARGGFVPFGLPSGYFAAHILIAAFGWVGAMVAGVGAHLVPMFALSKPGSELPLKLALPVWAAIPIFALLSAFHPGHFMAIAWILAAVASGLWTIQFTLYLLRRTRKESDQGILMTVFSTAFLATAWIVLISIRAHQAFIGMIVVGWLTLFTLGIYHRVIPFLVWFLRFAGGAGRGRIPKVKDLLDERLMRMTAALSASGIAIWAFGLIAHGRFAACFGPLLFLIGAATCLLQLRYLRGIHAVHTRFSDDAIEPSH